MSIEINDKRLPAAFWAGIYPQENGCWAYHFHLGMGIPTLGRRASNYRRLYVYLFLDGNDYVDSRIVGNMAPAYWTTVVDHVCENRWCINPNHLELVSAKENTQRFWARMPKAKRAERREAIKQGIKLWQARGSPRWSQPD